MEADSRSCFCSFFSLENGTLLLEILYDFYKVWVCCVCPTEPGLEINIYLNENTECFLIAF